jgi:hypothetical protein
VGNSFFEEVVVFFSFFFFFGVIFFSGFARGRVRAEGFINWV